MPRSRFVAGQWNAWCPVCGFEYKSARFRKRWDGLMVCYRCWNPKPLQYEPFRVPSERPLPWTSREPAPTYAGDTFGIGYWRVDNPPPPGVMYIPPYNKDTQPVEFETWLHEFWAIRYLGAHS